MIKEADILQALKDFQPNDPVGADAKARTLQMIRSSSKQTNRSTVFGHITCSAWIVDESGEKALLHYHKVLDRWLQLGGHCEESDKSLLAAAQREAMEESGLKEIAPLSHHIFDIDIHLIPSVRSERAHFHYDFRFCFQADSSKPLIKNDRVAKLAWIKMDDLEFTTTESSLLRLRDLWHRLRSTADRKVAK